MTPPIVSLKAEMAQAEGVTVDDPRNSCCGGNGRESPRRAGQPEVVARVIAILCAEVASLIDGTNLRVDRGSVASI
jgi:NAD(P)-dependent dehydrogenase (short-subunit alcohol dehydrogenase family)